MRFLSFFYVASPKDGIYYDYTSQSVAWGPDLDEVSRELFTSYGKLIASQITRYL